jgi:hypothetical protein
MVNAIKTYTVELDGRAKSKVYKRPNAAVSFVNSHRRWNTAGADRLTVVERVYSLVAQGEYTPKTKKTR